MKKIAGIILILLLLNAEESYSQIVTENIQFDNYISSSNNDFTNYFTGGLGLSQIPTNGITGGCLTTPLTVNWGNDNAIYCSKYIAADSTYSNTRLSFKYDTSQINSSNFDRAVSIFLRPSIDFNHYIIASVNYNKRLQIVSYSWANSPPLLNLQHDHWYEFLLNTAFVADSPVYQINISAQVNDLGITGQFPPIPVGNSSGALYDSLLYGDTAVEVSFIAARWGGTKYVDNFHFEGIKSADSCTITTGITRDSPLEFDAIINSHEIIVTNYSGTKELEVYNVTGAKVLSAVCHTGYSVFDISGLPQGIYFLRESNNIIIKSKKFVVMK